MSVREHRIRLFLLFPFDGTQLEIVCDETLTLQQIMNHVGHLSQCREKVTYLDHPIVLDAEKRTPLNVSIPVCTLGIHDGFALRVYR